MARLDHPNIVRCYRFGEEHGMHYLAIEFVDGGSMEDWVKKLGKLEVGDALSLDAFALGFLLFFLKCEVHAQGVLFGLLLGLDGAFERRRQLHIPQQHVLHNHAARLELGLQFVLNLLLHKFARVRV